MSLLVRPCAATVGSQSSLTWYQVLDVSPDEQDPKVIEEAALLCSGQVRVYQLTCEPECTRRLNEIGQALITLLDPVRRREYDLSLGKPLSPARSERRLPGERDTPALPRGKSTPPALGEDTHMLLVREGEACDVRLVYRRGAR